MFFPVQATDGEDDSLTHSEIAAHITGKNHSVVKQRYEIYNLVLMFGILVLVFGNVLWQATSGGEGTPYIRMIGMIVVFFRGCNRRFSIFLGVVQVKSIKK